MLILNLFMKLKLFFCFFLFALILISCQRHNNRSLTIDFDKKDSSVNSIVSDSNKVLKVAISAMISPKQTFVFYQELLDYLSLKTNYRILLEQRKTYKEVNDLLSSGELDFAFICSGAYVELSQNSKTDILVVPQSNGMCTYQAFIIANNNSLVSNFEDFKGKKFAYTDLLSNSGRLYALKRLKEIGYKDADFFSNIVFSNAHDNSIQLVNKGLVDGATVDGLIFNFLKTHNPDKISNIKVIEKSEMYGIPPIVSRLDKKAKLEIIRKALLTMDKDTTGKKILSKIQIDRFVPGYDSSYNSIRKILNFVKK